MNIEHTGDDTNNILRKILKEQLETKDFVVKIDRRQRWARNINILYIIILIGGVLGLYSLARPYFSSASRIFKTVQHNFSFLKSAENNLEK